VGNPAQMGQYGNAAVIHDYCYWEQSRSRLEADRIFREAMEVLQVPRWKVRAMYYSVRLGAGLAWSGNRRKKEKGISRIAAVMPVKSVEVPKSLQAKG